jgi:outer membrane lipopolysaccharide assembly protein LptE/RlpB
MKKNFIQLFLLIALIMGLSGCGTTVQNDLLGAYNMTQCKYAYNSLSNISVSGVQLTSGNTLSALNLAK